MAAIFMPQIFTNTDGHDHNMDLYSYRFLKERKIYLNGEVNTETARMIMEQLAYLDRRSDEDITLIINSPGGSVSDGLAIFDMIKYGIHCDVVTVATGMAASMGAFLLAAGTKGKRYATPNAEIMIHQPLGGVQGQATDISVVAEHITGIKTKLAKIMAEACGRSVKTLLKDMERDYWLSAEKAKQYGLIDEIGMPD